MKKGCSGQRTKGFTPSMHSLPKAQHADPKAKHGRFAQTDARRWMANAHPLFAWLSKPTANAQKTHRRAHAP
jgi:hypothetical protein